MNPNSTGVWLDRSSGRWECEAGHRHGTELLARRCQGARDHKVATWVRSLMKPAPAFLRALTRWRPIPADQRDDEVAAVRYGEFDWAAFRASLQGWVLTALVGFCIVAVIGAAEGLNLAMQWLLMTGHELIVLAFFALVAAAIGCVPLVQKPSVRRALRWLREMYS